MYRLSLADDKWTENWQEVKVPQNTSSRSLHQMLSGTFIIFIRKKKLADTTVSRTKKKNHRFVNSENVCGSKKNPIWKTPPTRTHTHTRSPFKRNCLNASTFDDGVFSVKMCEILFIRYLKLYCAMNAVIRSNNVEESLFDLFANKNVLLKKNVIKFTYSK